jgi:hypothetical protein
MPIASCGAPRSGRFALDASDQPLALEQVAELVPEAVLR